MPAMRTVPRRSFTSPKASFATRSVVMMARATSLKRSSARSAIKLRKRFLDQREIQLDADHAGGCRQHLRGRQFQELRRGAAGGQGHALAGARGAVGVAGIHQDGAHLAPRNAQMLAAELHGCGLHAVLRENGGGGGGHAGNNEREIVARLRADSGVRGGVSVTKRQIQFGYSPRISLFGDALAVGECFGAHALAAFELHFQKLEHPAIAAGHDAIPGRRPGRESLAAPFDRAPDVEELAAKTGVSAGPRQQAAHAIVDRRCRLLPVNCTVFFF